MIYLFSGHMCVTHEFIFYYEFDLSCTRIEIYQNNQDYPNQAATSALKEPQ
jgi:hypothetical protein